MTNYEHFWHVWWMYDHIGFDNFLYNCPKIIYRVLLFKLCLIIYPHFRSKHVKWWFGRNIHNLSYTSWKRKKIKTMYKIRIFVFVLFNLGHIVWNSNTLCLSNQYWSCIFFYLYGHPKYSLRRTFVVHLARTTNTNTQM